MNRMVKSRIKHMSLTPFHIAFPVRCIAEARTFYGNALGFPEGRSAPDWIDFNMFGHQVVAHLDPSLGPDGRVAATGNPVDGHQVPVPHFGVVLTMNDWEQFRDRVAKVISEFVIEPYIRFPGEVGEQATLFFLDPSGNALEFKAFRDIDSQLFAS
jgi:extradiol dioxygenase family protein